MKLLLVHHLRGLLDNYVFQLRLHDVKCDGACDWNECISLCNVSSYDLVLISDELPEFPPELLAAYLTYSLPREKAPPRVAVLGDCPDDYSVEDLRKAGISGILPHPEDISAFIAECRSILARKQETLPAGDPAVKALVRASVSLLQALRAKRHFQVEYNSADKAHKELILSLDYLRRHLTSLATDALISITTAAEVRDPYLRGHNKSVSTVAYHIGKKMGLPAADLEELVKGALLHDIGKIGIPDKILNKQGPLTPEERAAIRSHPLIGVTILEKNEIFVPYLDIVKYHHERLDGSGYPFGLKGDEIPHSAQIVAVADVFSALTTARSYREAVTPERALEDIYPLRGVQLNADAVDALADYVKVLQGGAMPVVFSLDDTSLPEILRHLTTESVQQE